MVDIEEKSVKEVYQSIVGYEVNSWDYRKRNAWIFRNSNLTLDRVKNAKPLKLVVKEVRELVRDTLITSYNVEYDFTKFLCCSPWNLDEFVHDICNCIMIASAAICQLPGFYQKYKWPRLDIAYRTICKNNPVKIETQTHRAMDDALLSAYVLVELIKTNNYELS